MRQPQLQAVIFDVDGTLAETERHGHRVAFNKAFEQEGLDYRWSDELYRELVKTTGGDRRIAHFLTTYENADHDRAWELARRLHPIKTELFVRTVSSGEVPPRAGAVRFIDALQTYGLRTAVATTGTASWVHPLLDHLVGKGNLKPFEVIVTGNDVARLKPDPEAFVLALERLDLAADEVIIVEDSRNGVRACEAVGSPCVAVRGEYARVEDLAGADLILDQYGEPGAGVEVLGNRWGLEGVEMLTPEVVVELHRRRFQPAGS